VNLVREPAPAKDGARGRVIALRRTGLSTYEISAYEISARLAAEGTALNRTSVAEILIKEGFGRVLHPEPEASTSPGTPGRDTHLPRTTRLDLTAWPRRVETGKAGLLLLVPNMVALDLPALTRRAVGSRCAARMKRLSNTRYALTAHLLMRHAPSCGQTDRLHPR